MKRVALSLLLAAFVWAGDQPTEFTEMVEMRDGVHLSTHVFLPHTRTRVPAVLQRTPYGKVTTLTPGLKAFIDHGYAVITQDVRGRYASEGEFNQFLQERRDGEDTLSWIERQTWSNGRVGMFGGSYVGIVQYRAALSAHPALKAIAPAVSGGDEYFDRYYTRGGAFRLSHRLRWVAENYKPEKKNVVDFKKMTTYLPLRRADRLMAGRRLDFYQAVMDHPSYDDYWRALSTRQQIDRLRAPAQIEGGWYDTYADSDLEMWSALRARGLPARIIIGPWGHNMSPDMPGAGFGPQASAPLRRMEIEWFDAYVKQSAPAPSSVVRYFVTGQNVWRESPVWPPLGEAPTAFYLDAQKGANSLNGDGRLQTVAPHQAGEDRFDYDPRKAVPTVGGALCCNSRVQAWGPLDQRKVEGRRDVLVYTGDALKDELEVAGSPRAVLYITSSAPDTDFTAKLVDVAPDGDARILTDGILRLRYRLGVERVASYTPGTVERIEIRLAPIAHEFAIGHHVRLEITSSNFPKYDRNMNTGRPQADEKEQRVAHQRILRGHAQASHLVLPVIK